ncbi:MAG: MBL fold metallo-hydrolase [Christensenellaceae bacterium]
MKILCVPTGPLSVNTYIVFNESAETLSNSERIPCVVIDPANSHKVVEVLNQNNLHCTHILLTHGHFDHTMGVAELKSHENALVATTKRMWAHLQAEKQALPTSAVRL